MKTHITGKQFHERAPMRLARPDRKQFSPAIRQLHALLQPSCEEPTAQLPLD